MISKGLRLFVVLFLAVFLLGGCAGFERKLFDWGVSVERYRSDLVVKTICVAGQNIACLERMGEGDTIVLIHGFGANKDTWIHFIRYLPKDFHVFAIDLAGHGDSRMDMDMPHDIRYLTDILALTIESMDMPRFHLAGHSLGGYVAMLYAAEKPQKLMTLGLFAPAGVLCSEPTDFQLALERGVPPIKIDSAESFDRMMDLVFYKKPFMPWPVRPVLVRQCIDRNKFEEKMWNDMLQNHPNANELLLQMQMPVFLLWGDKDRIMDVSCVTVYQRDLTDVETVIIENCGHGLIYEKSEETANAYAKFLQNAKSRNMKK
jgi:pimeloyl-ACP methyl ester carboxylesterase